MAVTDPTTQRIVEFIAEISLILRWDRLDEPTVLPGITTVAGELVADASKLDHPGDLLHEAGHLAVVPAAQRASLTDSDMADGGIEMSAIAWSYAAVRHLGLDPTVVFHADGYHGGSAAIIENFNAGRYFGVPVLQWLGMTATGENAESLGVPPYPHMIRWVLG